MGKVLVTGGAGYIGSHTVRRLRKQGYNVVVYDNLSKGHEWAVKDAPLIVGDIADCDKVCTRVRQDKAYDTYDGTCIRDYIHINDLADAHILALEYLRHGQSDVFNLGNGKGFSVKEIVDATVKNETRRDFGVSETTQFKKRGVLCISKISQYEILEDLVKLRLLNLMKN